MKLAELLEVMSTGMAITILTWDEEIPFMGYKLDIDDTLEQDEESEEKTKLINCLSKEVMFIKRQGYWMQIKINALKEEITPECQEPDSDCRP